MLVLLYPIVWCYVWHYVWLNVVISKVVLLLSKIMVTWIFGHYHLVGSKTLGIKCIRISMYNVLENHDQNLESSFRLLKVCLFVKLESSEL